MSGYFLKNPGSLLDYSFDWGFQLFEPGETIETDLGWTVVPDNAVDGGLVVPVGATAQGVGEHLRGQGEPAQLLDQRSEHAFQCPHSMASMPAARSFHTTSRFL